MMHRNISVLNGNQLESEAQTEARAKAMMRDLSRMFRDLGVRQQALDDAALHHDHPGFIEALLDELSQPHMRDAFIRQCQDIVESKDDAEVNPAFARAVRRVAIEFFGEPI